MKLFKETLEFLKSGEFFSGVIERMFALLVTIVFFAAIIVCYVFKPIILLYVLILGMLIMGWFMLYFIFPEAHEWLHATKRRLLNVVNKLKNK